MTQPPKEFFQPRYTTSQVAAALDRDPSVIRYHHRTNGIGTRLSPRVVLYSDADLERLKQVATGSKTGRRPGPQEPGTRKKVRT